MQNEPLIRERALWDACPEPTRVSALTCLSSTSAWWLLYVRAEDNGYNPNVNEREPGYLLTTCGPLPHSITVAENMAARDWDRQTATH